MERIATCGPLALLAPGCALEGAAPEARHVIFVSLDTTRRDHPSLHGNPWILRRHVDSAHELGRIGAARAHPVRADGRRETTERLRALACMR